MNTPPEGADGWVQAVLAILDFVFEQHFWKLFLLLTVSIFHKGIANFVGRLIKAQVKIPGMGEGGLEASPPVLLPEVSPVAASKSESPSEPPPAELLEEQTPASLWVAYQTLRQGDSVKAEEQFRTYIQTVADPQKHFDEEAFFEYLKFSETGDEVALNRLASMFAAATDDHEFRSTTTWLASCYGSLRDYEKEEKVWRRAIAQVKSESIKTTFFVGLANLQEKKGLPEVSIELLSNRLHEGSDAEQLATIYNGFANFEKRAGRLDGAAIALEKVVEYSPGDKDKLFAAAYLQSERGLRLLSVANYQALLDIDRHNATAHNNLGVCAGALDLPGKKIEEFDRAIEGESTLAMANVANVKIDVGLFDEAKKILDEARVKDQPHENVGSALFRLEKARQTENEKWESATKRGIEFQRRVRVYGTAMFDKPVPAEAWAGLWYDSRGAEVPVTATEKTLAGEWISEVEALFSTTKYKYSIVGHWRNRSASISYEKREVTERRGIASSVLSAPKEESFGCFSYMTPDRKEWHFFGTDLESTLKFVLTRQKPES